MDAGGQRACGVVTARIFRTQSVFLMTCEFCGSRRVEALCRWNGKALYQPCYCLFRLETESS